MTLIARAVAQAEGVSARAESPPLVSVGPPLVGRSWYSRGGGAR